MVEHDLVIAAMRYAADLHADTFRPDSKRTPFITHLSEVATLVAGAGGGAAEIAAAWLHDGIEDGLTTVEDITARFGGEVAALVVAVTDPVPLRQESIRERKDHQAVRLSTAPAAARRIKLAEQISILRALAVERPLSWTVDRSINYVAGADQVAAVCHGASPLLDAEFATAYALAHASLPMSS
ncbi:MAG: HD domain-containing protein [Azospirillaceae bacterium]|nr:HD domain-containing protein [Azospirillaceae bacterium]